MKYRNETRLLWVGVFVLGALFVTGLVLIGEHFIEVAAEAFNEGRECVCVCGCDACPCSKSQGIEGRVPNAKRQNQ